MMNMIKNGTKARFTAPASELEQIAARGQNSVFGGAHFKLRVAAVLVAGSLLSACGGGGSGGGTGSGSTGTGTGAGPGSSSSYSVGGTISGLASGAQITLADNGSDLFTAKANGAFTFAKALTSGSNFSAAIQSQPPGQTCSISNAAGASITANISNLAVVCCSSTMQMLYSFVSGVSPSGWNPVAGLVQGPDGNFYGTAAAGGVNNGGVVYKISATGTVTVLTSFDHNSISDAQYPYSSLILGTDGNFYGTTMGGGTSASGTVYQITPAGVEHVIYSFTDANGDGAYPYGSLLQDSAGNLYGTTTGGGLSNNGTIFKLSPGGVETVLYQFNGGATDGSKPSSQLILGKDGNFYGTTPYGGANNGGTVFKMTPGGALTILHSFTGGADGYEPYAGLVLAIDGNMYGTTVSGGSTNLGAIYKVDPSGNVSTVYSFQGNFVDGDGTYSSLIQGNDGNLYGTTLGGGTQLNGTLFKLTLIGKESVLYSFTGVGGDRAGQYSALIQATDGHFYGTANLGGANNLGSVFRF